MLKKILNLALNFIGGDLNARIGNLKRLYYTLFRGSYTPLL